MSIGDYCRLVATKLDEASAKGDKDEVIRLMNLLAKTCHEEVAKLEAQ